MDELLTLLQAAASAGVDTVTVILVVLWLLSKGKLRTESELNRLENRMQKRIDEVTVDRNFYRQQYADGEELRADRDYYRDKVGETTNILGTLLSTVEVEEEDNP